MYFNFFDSLTISERKVQHLWHRCTYLKQMLFLDAAIQKIVLDEKSVLKKKNGPFQLFCPFYTSLVNFHFLLFPVPT